MGLPVRVFWLMHNNVSRIRAEQDIRAANVARAGMVDSEGFSELQTRLKEEMGEVVRGTLVTAHRDTDAADQLRELSGG